MRTVIVYGQNHKGSSYSIGRLLAGKVASAPMKSFIDLTFINWMAHRPKAHMFYKKAVVISTAAGAGTKKAMKDITTSLF